MVHLASREKRLGRDAGVHALSPPRPRTRTLDRVRRANLLMKHGADNDLDELTRSYLREVDRCPTCAPGDQRELARRTQSGDVRAHRMLVESMLNDVIVQSLRYEGRGLPLLDLIEEGNLGLLKAAAKYSADMPTPFRFYAIRSICGHMERALMSASRADPVGVQAIEMARIGVRAAFLRSEPAAGRGPSARRSGRRYRQFLHVLDRQSPSGAMAPPDATPAGLDDAEPGVTDDPVEAIWRFELTCFVARCIRRLNPDERFIVHARYGLGGGSPARYADLAKRLNRSQERVRQMEEQALRSLREALLERGIGPLE